MRTIIVQNSLIFAVLLLVSSSCSTGSRQREFVAPSLPGDDLETLVLMGINDLHGALAPEDARTRESAGTEPVPYKKGGMAYLATHVRQLRDELGSRLLLLDAGDEFQGSVDSNSQEGAPMVQAFNQLGVTAATIGNHEFDFGPEGPEGVKGDVLGALKARMREARFPYVSSNIVVKGTGKRPEFPNTVPRLIVQAGRTRVGILGLTTLETPVKTRPEHVKDLEFTDLKAATLREAKALRREGAQVIVAVAHVGLECEPGRAGSGARVRKASEPQGRCDDRGELVRLLRSLPAGTLDAVVSGHSHWLVHHWVFGVPVVQGSMRGQFFNLLYLTYDHKAGRLVPDLARIEGPVPVCPRVFANQNDCDGDRPAPPEGRGSLVKPELHGRSIGPDAEMEAVLAPVFARSETERRRIVGQAARPLAHTKVGESEMGNFVADAIRDSVGADFGLMNAGGVRTGLEGGPVTFEALFRVLPFENAVSLLTVTGRELKGILRLAENGSRGFFAVSGLKLRAIELDQEAPSNDLNGNNRIDTWEFNRLIDARLDDGTKIRDEKTYRLATIDFLVTGGDDMGWAMEKLPRDRVKLVAGPVLRDVVMEYLARKSPVNTVEAPLIRPDAPRLKLEKAPTGGGKRKRRSRR